MGIFYRIIVAAVFLVPLSAVVEIPNTDTWYSQYIMLFSLFCIGISAFLWKFNKWVSILSALCWLSAIYTNNQNSRGILILMQFDLSCLAAYVVSMLDEKHHKFILKMIFIVFLLQVGLVTLQFFNLDPIFDLKGHPELDDTVGLSGSKNQVGLFFAIVSPVVISQFPALFPAVIWGLYCSQTTTAWIGLTVAIFVYTCFIWKKSFIMFWGMVFILMACTYFYFTKWDSVTDTARNERWQVVVNTVYEVDTGRMIVQRGNIQKQFNCNRWLGYGIGKFMQISPFSQNKYLQYQHRYEHVHNDYIEAFWEMGKLFFMFLMLWVGDLLYRFFSLKNKTKHMIVAFCAVLAQMICSLGIYTVHTAVSGMLLIIFYGILEKELRDGKASGLV